jgi:hypothetical protein
MCVLVGQLDGLFEPSPGVKEIAALLKEAGAPEDVCVLIAGRLLDEYSPPGTVPISGSAMGRSRLDVVRDAVTLRVPTVRSLVKALRGGLPAAMLSLSHRVRPIVTTEALEAEIRAARLGVQGEKEPPGWAWHLGEIESGGEPPEAPTPDPAPTFLAPKPQKSQGMLARIDPRPHPFR